MTTTMKTLILCLALVGCTSSTKSTSAPATEPVPAVQANPEGPNEADQAKPTGDKNNSCIDDCMQRRMAEAVSAEVIEAGCAQECGDQLAVAKRAADLQLKSGQTLIIQGRLERESGGFVLHLADGHVVSVRTSNPLALEGKVGSAASLKGVYENLESGHQLSKAELAGLHIR